VTGHLLVDRTAIGFEKGVATIRIEDARRADAAAVTIADMVIEGIVHVEGEAERIAFALECPAPPEGRQWVVRAALDQPGGGQFTTERVHVDARDRDVLLPLHHHAGSAT